MSIHKYCELLFMQLPVCCCDEDLGDPDLTALELEIVLLRMEGDAMPRQFCDLE